MEENFTFSELVRRVSNLIRIGRIQEILDDKVRVRIDKILTPWLCIFSTASSTKTWIPIEIGEQVAVLSPFGNLDQGVVLRSIYYNNFLSEKDKENVLFTSEKDVRARGKNLEISFLNGIEIKNGDAVISLKNGAISLKCGDAMINLSSGGMSFEVGNSLISITRTNIDITSSSLNSNSPFCKCGEL